MKPRRMTGRWWLGLVAILFAVGLGACNRTSPSALPSFHRYEALPAPFNQALQRLHEQRDAHPNDFDVVRKLAYLYQANRLNQEAKACYALLASAPAGPDRSRPLLFSGPRASGG